MNDTANYDFLENTEVIVVGYGYAGAIAAITAHDHGAKVTIVEKMPQAGGNSRVSGGNCLVPFDTNEAEANFCKYLNHLSMGTTPEEVIRTFVKEAKDQVEWFASIGGELSVPEQLIVADTYPRTIKGPGFPGVEGGESSFLKHCLRGPAEVPPSLRMWNLLSENVEKRGINVLLDTPALDLIKDEQGKVVGLVVRHQGEDLAIKAPRGVILTCGGFENNKELKWDNIPPKPLMFIGNPGNTGDGIRMAQRVGADLWHMSRTSCIIGFQSPEFEAAFGIFFPSDGFIYLDKYGKRYCNETDIELHEYYRLFSEFNTHNAEFTRIPTWAIFNEETRKAGPLTWDCSGYNRDLYRWSEDNSREIKKGWIVKADSISELAEKTGLSQAAIEETLCKYNHACETGMDDEFNRDRSNLRALQAPYYAIPLHPAVLNTQGGAKRDQKARVIDTKGNPIPGLYSAGEFGSIWGYLYQGATNITECIVFGRIAGKEAAANVCRA